MTLPNRRNYAPGEQKRARKCVTTAAAAAPQLPTVASRTRASGKQRAMARTNGTESKRVATATALSPLQAEMVAELAAFSPLHELLSEAAAVPRHQMQQQHHAARASLTPLLLSKQQLQQRAEAARLRLLDDELFKQQNARGNRLLAMSSAAAATLSDGVDPLHAAVQMLPAIDESTDSDAMESVLADLQSIGAGCVQELAAPLAVLDEVRVCDAYRDAISALQTWHARQLQQSRQALLLGSASPSASSGSATSSSSPSPLSSMASSFLRAGERQQVKKRANLSKTAKAVLKAWFDNHLHHPYPTEEEKDALARRGGITLEQVNNWFINTRGRKWKPMLSRLMAEKEAGECKLFDQMVQRIEEPYRRAPTKR